MATYLKWIDAEKMGDYNTMTNIEKNSPIIAVYAARTQEKWAEYEKKNKIAWEEYEGIVNAEWKRYEQIDASAYAEYEERFIRSKYSSDGGLWEIFANGLTEFLAWRR